MKIVIAPDKFKGALSAEEAAVCIAKGIRETFSSAQCELVPIADGGEGTADVLSGALGGIRRTTEAHDALGNPVKAQYAWVEQKKTAIFDMSEVAGLGNLSPESFDLDQASTFGVGEMMIAAFKAGAREMIVGLGGSMTNDGGFGMARALGWHFLNSAGRSLDGPVSGLSNLARIQFNQEGSSRFRNGRILAAVDVQNPLLGPDGATHVFAEQKGADDGQIQQLENALTRFADVVERDLAVSRRNEAGAGAAGGLGFGLMAFCSAEIRSGFDIVADAIGLEEKLRTADVLITGEGRLDRQTLAGKAPGQVARMARRLGKVVLAVVGKTDGTEELRELFDQVFEVAVEGASDAENLRRAGELLCQGGRKVGQHLASLAGSDRQAAEHSPAKGV